MKGSKTNGGGGAGVPGVPGGGKGLPRRFAQGSSREDLDRSCWDWVDEVDDPKTDHIDEWCVGRAYRLHYPTHYYPDQNCKRNCKYNPRCYCGKRREATLLEVRCGSVA